MGEEVKAVPADLRELANSDIIGRMFTIDNKYISIRTLQRGHFIA